MTNKQIIEGQRYVRTDLPNQIVEIEREARLPGYWHVSVVDSGQLLKVHRSVLGDWMPKVGQRVGIVVSPRSGESNRGYVLRVFRSPGITQLEVERDDGSVAHLYLESVYSVEEEQDGT